MSHLAATGEQQYPLPYFPISLFASVMGLTGLTLAYQRFEKVFEFNLGIGFTLWIVSNLLFLTISFFYFAKFLLHKEDVLKEFDHPVKFNFFPAISISFMLLSAATSPYAITLAKVEWVIGTVLHFFFTLLTLSRWILKEYKISYVNPSVFLPVVGNIIVPIYGSAIAPPEINWYFFSVGIFFWLILTVVVMYRMFFAEAIPQKLLPTLFILIAPPSVSFTSYYNLTGSIDSFAKVLFSVTLFYIFLILSMIGRFIRIPFFISWWAYTFPMCAATIASINYLRGTGQPFIMYLSYLLLFVTTLIVGTVFIRTIIGVFKNEICVPD